MHSKFLAAAIFATAFVPAIANADQVTSGSADSGSSRFVAFMTRLIVPDTDQAIRPVAYADDPELIGHRAGSTKSRWVQVTRFR